MGISTLHRHFGALTAMSVLSTKLHIHEARRRMLVDAVDASGAAFSVGYESPT